MAARWWVQSARVGGGGHGGADDAAQVMFGGMGIEACRAPFGEDLAADDP